MARPPNPFLQPLLTPTGVRMLAGCVFASAVAMPWVAWWMGAFGVARELTLPEQVIELRPALVELPGGTFWMGSTPGEQDRAIAAGMKAEDGERWYRDERRHQVEVGPFALCRTEVTQGQWKAVMGVSTLTLGQCGGEACDDARPVTGVSWNQAVEYMNSLTDRENEHLPEEAQLTRCYARHAEVQWDRACTGYRLPTEAEWEYAARAGSETAYFFGDDAEELCTFANGADATARRKYPDWTTVACDDGAADLAPVATYRPSSWGLYDVHGNVWEWVWDRYGDYPEQPGADQGGPAEGESRVLRGGSFWHVPRDLRSAVRGRDTPTVTDWGIGLRCARGPHPQP